MKKDGLGEKIIYLRTKQNLRQSDLALMAKIPQAQLCVIEGGKRIPRLTTLQKISKALGVEVHVFFKDKLPQSAAVSANDMIRMGAYLVKLGRHQKRASL